MIDFPRNLPRWTFALAALLVFVAVAPTGRAEISPGPVIPLEPTFAAPDPTFLESGEWGVPTVSSTPVTGVGLVGALLSGSTTTVAAGSGPNTGQGAALDAAHAYLRGNSPVWSVAAPVGELREGDRVIAANGTVPDDVPEPGEWLVGNTDGFRNVTVGPAERVEWDRRNHVGLQVDGFPLPDVSGSSGSLAMAVAWVDALTPGDLTGGRKVALTGEVNSVGAVHEIRYAEEKAAGAAAGGYEFYDTPGDTLAEVVRFFQSR